MLTDDEVATVLEPPPTVLSPRTDNVAPTEKRRTKFAVLLSDEEEEEEVDEAGGGVL